MDIKMHTVKDIRSYLSRELKSVYPEHEINALTNIIIKTILDVSGLHHVHNNYEETDPGKIAEIIRICNELRKGKPYQYITGETEFYNLKIKVNPSVLIPRQETEELVDLIIRENSDFKGEIIDFGTGSGCIAIALASNLRQATITGIDNSPEALKLAAENALLNNVNINLVHANILEFDNKLPGEAGIIVSNPPYVRVSEKKAMHRNVLDFEPHNALFVDDARPLVFYEAILNIAAGFLIPGGRIYFEINEAMGKEMAELMSTAGYSDIRVIKDLNGRDRMIKGIKNV